MASTSRGPEVVATIFKVCAVVVLAAGLLAALATGVDLERTTLDTTRGIVVISLSIAGSAIVVSAAVAFFAYVLELLLQIRNAVEVTAEEVMAFDEEGVA